MNAVVDTNVIAYYLLGTQPFSDECSRFWKSVEQAFAPAVWEAEIANVLWMAVRGRVLSDEESHRRLYFVARLGIRSVATRTLWQGALARALDSGVSVYDTLFVELAARQRLPLATFDTGLLQAFGDITRCPAALL